MHNVPPKPCLHLLSERQLVEFNHVRMPLLGSVLGLAVAPPIHCHTAAPVVMLHAHRYGGVFQDVADTIADVVLLGRRQSIPRRLRLLADDTLPLSMRLPSELRDVFDGHQVVAGQVVLINWMCGSVGNKIDLLTAIIHERHYLSSFAKGIGLVSGSPRSRRMTISIS